MGKTRTVRLGNRKRKWLNVECPVELLRVNDDGTIVTDDAGDPVTDTDVRTYRVPLRGSLKMGEVLLFRTPDGGDAEGLDAIAAFHKLLSRYIPKDVVDEFDTEDLEDFYVAWDAASDAEGGPSQGE
ncbi:MAG: hypothetical protein IJ092_00875 [Atopobiaceae bacterium]|nr:hypothetical protein [Atopobiaceae bacterium]